MEVLWETHCLKGSCCFTGMVRGTPDSTSVLWLWHHSRHVSIQITSQVSNNVVQVTQLHFLLKTLLQLWLTCIYLRDHDSKDTRNNINPVSSYVPTASHKTPSVPPSMYDSMRQVFCFQWGMRFTRGKCTQLQVYLVIIFLNILSDWATSPKSLPQALLNPTPRQVLCILPLAIKTSLHVLWYPLVMRTSLGVSFLALKHFRDSFMWLGI
jgi:hypothetical protein